jgi:tetratricopeptide (TPR) repeat protein
MKTLALILFLFLGLSGIAVILWLIFKSIQRAEDPVRMAFKWAITIGIAAAFFFGIVLGITPSAGMAFVVPFVCVILGIVMSVLWAPHIGALFAKPLTAMFDGGDQDWKPGAMYSIAISKRKRGQFREGIAEIEKQLVRWPNDFGGCVLKAEIQAEDLHDLAVARETIEQILAQPEIPPRHVAYVLNQVADWELKYSQDYEAARLSLERIGELLPGSPEAQMAAQRLAHLNPETMQAAQDRTAIHLPTGVEDIGLLSKKPELPVAEVDPDVLVGEYVLHLEQHPLDAEVREKLALLYADHFKERELAVGQLQMLVNYPHQPHRQVARWLNLIADIHVKLGHDFGAAQASLQQIIDRYPALACASNAQQRLAHLKLELKGAEKVADVKMGSYEQNIGLKGRDVSRRDSVSQLRVGEKRAYPGKETPPPKQG